MYPLVWLEVLALEVVNGNNNAHIFQANKIIVTYILS